MPLTTICGIIGALAISSFPLTSGFTTKTLISVAAEQQGLVLVYFALAAASAGVFLHAGIKFPWFVFFQKDSGMRPKDAPWNMGAAMVFFAFLCIFIGVYPEPLWALLPYPVEYEAYAPGKVLFYVQLLLFSGLAFFLLLPLMKRTLTISLDTDWIWRVVLARSGLWLLQVLQVLGDQLGAVGESVRQGGGARLGRLLGSAGALGRTWQIGTTALWIAILLTGYVLLYYL
jgi:multicomponent Na+:H+ antiporter subunit D